jgi:hypothetical protein
LRNGSSEIHFGTPYEDEFRQYLLGGSGFPSNASLVVHVSSCEKAADVFTLPSGSKQDGFFRYDFLALGIVFTLLLGGRIRSDFRQLCIVRSPKRLIFLTDKVQEYAMESTAALITPLLTDRRSIELRNTMLRGGRLSNTAHCDKTG